MCLGKDCFGESKQAITEAKTKYFHTPKDPVLPISFLLVPLRIDFDNFSDMKFSNLYSRIE
jgi:hypothetical protein